jgi:hypothetical protein
MKKFLQFTITGTGLKALIGLDNIVNVVINSTTELYVYYSGTSSYKVKITFGTADSSYAPHYTVMQALNDSMIAASQPGGAYTVPTLPLKPSPVSSTDYNTISTVTYA